MGTSGWIWKIGNMGAMVLESLEAGPVDHEALITAMKARFMVSRYNAEIGIKRQLAAQHIVIDDSGRYAIAPELTGWRERVAAPVKRRTIETKEDLVPPPQPMPFKPLNPKRLPSLTGSRPDAEFWRTLPSKGGD